MSCIGLGAEFPPRCIQGETGTLGFFGLVGLWPSVVPRSRMAGSLAAGSGGNLSQVNAFGTEVRQASPVKCVEGESPRLRVTCIPIPLRFSAIGFETYLQGSCNTPRLGRAWQWDTATEHLPE